MAHTVIIGADPAGLTAAYELSRNRYPVTLLEASRAVGGLYRTENHQGYRIDLVQYGFATDIPTVRQLWDSLLEEESVPVEVRSLIYFRDRLFKYPLSFTTTLKHLGPIDTTLTSLSYLETWLSSQIMPSPGDQSKDAEEDAEEDAESWLKQRFGTHLYNIFFAAYFHKRWGSCARQLHSDCAIEMAQDIFNSGSLMQAIATSALSRAPLPKTQYPALGVGSLWQRCRALAEKRGAKVKLNTQVEKLTHRAGRIEQIALKRNHAPELDEHIELAAGDQVVSSLPLAALIHKLEPSAPANVIAAADCLRYRSLIVVALVIDKNVLFSEHEIHVQSPDVQVSTIQNFKNWSLERVADYPKTCLGMTYLCEQGDRLWNLDDSELVQLASHELIALKLIPEVSAWIESGSVVRQAEAYPVRSVNYYRHKAVVQRYLETFKNLKTVGRYGFDSSTRQDSSIFSGLIAARDIMRSPSARMTREKATKEKVLMPRRR